MALVGVDLPGRMDRLHLAFLGADLARLAALAPALQPVEQPQPRRDRQRRAERAQVAAVELAVDGRDEDQTQRPGDEAPLAHEAQRDRGLERLDLGELLGLAERLQRHREQPEQDQVLHRPQPLVHRKRQPPLADAELQRQLVDEFLQRAEGAEPAAVDAASPQQQRRGDEAPEDEHHRIDEKRIPPEAGDQRVREGQHVDDRQLREPVPADEQQRPEQEAVAKPRQQPRPRHQHVLEQQDQRQQRQARTEHRDPETALAPHRLPDRLHRRQRGRIRRGRHRGLRRACGAAAGGGRRRQRCGGQLQIARRRLVAAAEAREHRIERPGLAAHQQFELPRRARIEVVMLADEEDHHLAKARHAGRVDIAQALEVAVAEADRLVVLAQLHAIEDAAAHIARALERIAVAQHRDRVLAGRKPRHQPCIRGIAEQAAPDGRRVQVGPGQFDEGLVELLRRRALDAGGGGVVEGALHVGARQPERAHRAVAAELLPVGRRVDIGLHARRCALHGRRLADQAARDRDPVRRAHDALVDDHDGHGRAGDRIDADVALAVGGADLDAIGHALADVLRDELAEPGLGDADQQDRLVVFEHLRTGDAAAAVDADQRVDRLARIGRDALDLIGLEQVAEQLAAAVHGRSRRRAIGGRNTIGAREPAAAELPRRRRRCGRRDAASHEQQQRTQTAQDRQAQQAEFSEGHGICNGHRSRGGQPCPVRVRRSAAGRGTP